MKKRKILIVVLLFAAAGYLFYTYLWDREPAGPPPLHTETVQSGEISQRVIAHGSIQPVQNVTVGSQVSGIIDELNVDFNDRVEQGQILARIDPSTFEAEVQSAQAQLEAAQATLELAQLQWNRIEELARQQFVSPAESDVAMAELKQARAQLRVREHALDRAQRELDRCTITAPSDGIVISRMIDVGQTVAASLSAPALFEIATDLSSMWIHANVSEADIGRVEQGQQVRFQVDAYREETFEGTVIQVRNSPQMEDNVVHYETIIAVDNPDEKLKPGMTAEVSVIVNERTNALRIRNTALRPRLPDAIRPPDPDTVPDGHQIVYRWSNGRIQSHVVQPGLRDNVYTEILSGLSEGDSLVVGLSLIGSENERRQGLMTGQQAEY